MSKTVRGIVAEAKKLLDKADVRGLLEFARRFPKYRPLLVCDREYLATAAGFGLAAVPWADFLLSGPPVVSPDSSRLSP